MAKDVRHSTIAGSWYPGSPERLGETVDKFLANAGKGQIKGELVALIAPHAGYQYSGQVAAYAYVELQGREYDKVALLAPSHRVYVGEFAVTSYAFYETPLGLVPVDRDLVAQLEAQVPLNITDENLEHALEIQLPFLQRTLGEFSLLPILMGEQSWASCQRLGQGLAKVLLGQKALLVASTDLSHFYDYNTALRLDKVVLSHIEAFDPEGLSQDLAADRCEACGAGPVLATMLAARALGADKAKVLEYKNSGDVTGDKYRVVGYAAGVVYKTI
jgi:AmmeMemoRadiSam system protein B